MNSDRQNDKRWLPETEFRAIYSKVTRVCVDLVVATGNGVILTKRSIPPAVGMWHLPGGAILFGDTIEEALRSVAKNEICLEFQSYKLLGTIEYKKTESERGFYTIALAYLITESSGLLCNSDQGRAFGLFKELPEKLIPEQRRFLATHWSKICSTWRS